MMVGTLIIISIVIVTFILYQFLYNTKFKKSIQDLAEYNTYIKRLEEDRTKFFKRIDDFVYIEYGIEKYLIINLSENKLESTFRLTDDKTGISIKSEEILLKSMNKIILSKTFDKYNDKIFNVKLFSGSLVDLRTYDIMSYMVELTKEHFKSIDDSIVNEPIENFDIDDILDRINIVGYEKLTENEKEFLRKQK